MPTSDSSPQPRGTAASSSRSRGTSDKVARQIGKQVLSLRDQASGKIFEFAGSGKGRVDETLGTVAEMLESGARSLEEQYGPGVGQYANRAASAFSSFAGDLRGKSIEELVDDSRSVVRKNPVVAVGAAAVVGFALSRVVQAGLDDSDEDDGTRRALPTSTNKGASA